MGFSQLDCGKIKPQASTIEPHDHYSIAKLKQTTPRGQDVVAQEGIFQKHLNLGSTLHQARRSHADGAVTLISIAR
jgi:hypothetical protein